MWTRVGNEDKIEGLSPFLFVKRVEFHVTRAEGKLDQWLIRQKICDKIKKPRISSKFSNSLFENVELVDCFFNFKFTSNVYDLIYCDNKQQI